MKTKVLIVGGGISGTIAKKMLDANQIENILVTDQLYSPNQSAAFYLHSNVPEIKTEKIKINWEISSRAKYFPDQKRLYAEKVYENGNMPVSIELKSTTGYYVRPMQFNNLDGVIVARLSNLDMVKKIATLDTGKQLGYEFVISTIPLNNLLTIMGIGINFPFNTTSKPIYVIILESKKRMNPKEMLITYHPDKRVKQYRSTQFRGKIIREFMQPVKNSIRLSPGKIWCPAENLLTLKNTIDVLKSRGIYTVGRYANWDRAHLAHNSYEQVESFISMLKLDKGVIKNEF